MHVSNMTHNLMICAGYVLVVVLAMFLVQGEVSFICLELESWKRKPKCKYERCVEVLSNIFMCNYD